MARNTSTYAPQKKNLSGEVHDDVGFYRFDRARRRAVLRQFHVEGFVNQYVATESALDSDVLVFESEAIENIPAGWRARETYRFSGADAFEEIFELAEAGKDFALYSRAQLRRVRMTLATAGTVLSGALQISTHLDAAFAPTTISAWPFAHRVSALGHLQRTVERGAWQR